MFPAHFLPGCVYVLDGGQPGTGILDCKSGSAPLQAVEFPGQFGRPFSVLGDCGTRWFPQETLCCLGMVIADIVRGHCQLLRMLSSKLS